MNKHNSTPKQKTALSKRMNNQMEFEKLTNSYLKGAISPDEFTTRAESLQSGWFSKLNQAPIDAK